MNGILTVREVTEILRQKVEGAFPFVWIRGEVSNLSRPSSGHVYFSLKDADALLNCVWFQHQQRDAETFDPLTGECFEDGPRRSLALTVQNGQQLLCAGKVGIYPARGQYQLVVELAQDAGLGALQTAFEKIRLALAERGFFSQERKRPLPANPQRVAVVTSPTGAAIGDFLRMAGERGCGTHIRIFPALVQGAEAPGDIVRAMHAAQAQGWAQALVLIRGGGSLEDLWAFNEASVAEAVFSAGIPVVAGIGHEMDVTIADMTADLRAATPTHAAQLLWPTRTGLMQRLDALDQALQTAMNRAMAHTEERLARREQALSWLSPVRRLRHLEERFQTAVGRLERWPDRWLRAQESFLHGQCAGLRRSGAACVQALQVKLEYCTVKLDFCNPLAPLERGYVLLFQKGGLVCGVDGLALGEDIDVRLRDGSAVATVKTVLKGEGHAVY